MDRFATWLASRRLGRQTVEMPESIRGSRSGMPISQSVHREYRSSSTESLKNVCSATKPIWSFLRG